MHDPAIPKAPETSYMLDTNVFNDVLDGRCTVDVFKCGCLFATHIQVDEINKTPDPQRRRELMEVFEELTEVREPTASLVAGVSVAGGACPGGAGVVPTVSSVWGVSKWNASEWTATDNIYEGMRQDLDALNGGKQNNAKDILIAETAIRRGHVLVTADEHLRKVATKWGCVCVDVRNL